MDEERKRHAEEIAALLLAFLSSWWLRIYHFVTAQPTLPADIDALVDAAMVDAQGLYPAIIDRLETAFGDAARNAVEDAIRQAAVFTGKDPAVLAETLRTTSDGATQAAADRASEMLGMKRTPAGLVLDPEAEQTITQTTAERLKQVLTAAGEGTPSHEVEAAVEAAVNYSTGSRAEAIARTELGDIWAGIQFEIFTAAGIKWVDWVTTSGAPCPQCLMNELGSPVRLGQRFPSGAYRPTIHPWCGCVLEPAEEPEGD